MAPLPPLEDDEEAAWSSPPVDEESDAASSERAAAAVRAPSTPRFLSESGRSSSRFDYSDAGTPSLPVPLAPSSPSRLALADAASSSFSSSSSSLSSCPPAAVSSSPSPSGLPYRVYVALVLAQLCWSGFHVLGKYTFSFLSPFVLPTFRSLGVVPIFWLYAYRRDPKFWVIAPRQHALMLLESLLGNTLAQQCFNFGISLSSASLAGMLQPSIPVFTTLLAIALRREGVSRPKIVGIVIAIAGSLVMVAGGGGGGADSSASSNFTLGAFLFLVQCLSTSVYIIIQKPMFAQGMDVRCFTFYLFAYGAVGHILIGAFFLPSVEWRSLPLTLLPVLLYTIVVATFIAFSLFVYATNNLPASVSSLGITLQSFFSPLLGALVLGEVITWVDVLGGLAICVGIVIVVWAKVRDEQAGRDDSQQQLVDNKAEASDHVELQPVSPAAASKQQDKEDHKPALSAYEDEQKEVGHHQPDHRLAAHEDEEEEEEEEAATADGI